MLIGHQQQLDIFEQALATGRLHHAWLLAGPQGIGKRHFADHMAARLLGPGAESLMAAGSHPDVRVIAPPEMGKGSATSAILVDQLRELGSFLHSHPSLASHRVLIIDPADALNVSAANAFLKELEEPRPHSLFLLISHAPGRLLPTIRSRCRLLRFRPLKQGDVRAVLASLRADLSEARLDQLASLADGAPGRVISLLLDDLASLQAQLRAAGTDDVQALSLARSVQGTGAALRFETLAATALAELADQARCRPSPERLIAHGEASRIAGEAVRLAYDRAQVAVALANLLARSSRN
jgi:DNA polymerase-3 subunit delta'